MSLSDIAQIENNRLEAFKGLMCLFIKQTIQKRPCTVRESIGQSIIR